MGKVSRLGVIGLFGLIAPALWAQPDAGQLLREQQAQKERELSRRLPEAEVSVDAAEVPQAEGATTVVKGFQFRGYEGMATEAELQEVVQGAIGLRAGVAELQRLADRVTATLRAKGYFLSRAYLPPQDVTGGIIEIAVIQARSDGAMGLHRAAGVRLRESQLRRMVDAVVQPGEPLREPDLERVLLLMNDLPGLKARAVLTPGSQPGTTRIDTHVTEGPLLSGAVWADNFGNRYTGAWRGNGLVSVNDAFGLGDQFNAMLSGAEGLAQGRVAYSLPLGAHGLRGEIAYTGMRYELIGDLAALKAEGSAQTFSAGAAYPLVRRRAFRITATADYDFKTLEDEANNFTLRDKVLHSGTAGIAGDISDGFGGGGYSTWSVSLTGGNLDLSGNRPDEAADRLGPRTAGSYLRVNLAASRLQRIRRGLTGSATYFGQFSPDNLDSSEKFSLGGPYGVRAYPVGEATGDEGHLLNLELRQELPLKLAWGQFHVTGFLDTGRVTLYQTPWTGAVRTATGENSYWISGGGAGVGFSRPGRYSARVTYAHKIGSNPGRSVSGEDADGRDSDGRIWATAQLSF